MTSAVASTWRWLEDHPRRALAVALALATCLRLPFLDLPLQSDEGGFLMVARQWYAHGSSLYGDQWVDRPPLNIAVFRLAEMLGGTPVTVRLIALGFSLVTVGAAWAAGYVISGPRGAAVAAIVAAALSSNASLDGVALTGEATAVAFVMVSCALVLAAKYSTTSPQRGVVLALIGGAAAACAFLVKQNFVDAGLFGAVLLGVKPHKTWRLMVAGAVGMAVPLLATVVWARSDEGPGAWRLWHALFRFRRRAFDIVEDAASVAPLHRLGWLLAFFLISGMALLAWQLVVACLRLPSRRSLRIAVGVMFLYGVVGILAGASWWRHYLQGLVPVLALGAALAIKRAARRPWPQYAVGYTVVSAVVAALVVGVLAVRGSIPGADERVVGEYLRQSSHDGDSVFVAYGSPNVIETAGLTTPYPYAWSLPMRGRDPHLRLLVATLQGDDAPTWLVQIGDFDWWGIDTPEFTRVRQERYRVVATVCGHDIYLRRDVTRSLPPPPPCRQ